MPLCLFVTFYFRGNKSRLEISLVKATMSSDAGASVVIVSFVSVFFFTAFGSLFFSLLLRRFSFGFVDGRPVHLAVGRFSKGLLCGGGAGGGGVVVAVVVDVVVVFVLLLNALCSDWSCVISRQAF